MPSQSRRSFIVFDDHQSRSLVCVVTVKSTLAELACERSNIYFKDGCGQATVSADVQFCPRQSVRLRHSALIALGATRFDQAAKDERTRVLARREWITRDRVRAPAEAVCDIVVRCGCAVQSSEGRLCLFLVW